jgi:DNA-binding transcriptional LysR family regulator
MDLRHLETFAKIAELKSFTKAAEELFLTQPTVSKQIVDLERYFQVKLIDRTKRSVALTRAGDILLKYARDFLYLKKETVDAIAAFRGLKTGKLLIGASTIPGIYVLPQVIKLFKRMYEGIQIKLLISDTVDILNKTESGETDIGFVGAKDATRKVEYRKLVDDTILIAAPLDYPDSMPVQELTNYPVIGRETGSGTRNAFDLALKKLRRFSHSDLKIVAELTDTQAIKESVKNGMGMAYISKMAVTDELARGTVKHLHVEGFPEIKRSFYMVTKRGKTPLPQVKALIEIIDGWRKHGKD